MRHKGLISVEEGNNKHPSAKPSTRTLVEMQGLTATSKVTKTRYKKVGGKYVPVAVDGIALKRSDQVQDAIEELSPADFVEEFFDEALTGQERHEFQLMAEMDIDDDESESPFIG